MNPSTLQVTTDGETHTIHTADRSKALTDLLRQANVPLNTRCGSRGLCDGCRVDLISGTLRHREDHTIVSEAVSLQACQYQLAEQPAAIVVPARSLLRHTPQVVSDYEIRITAANDPLVPITAGTANLGAAVDIGTTTVALLLVDLRDGSVIARASKFNQQMHLGDDVVTRINLCLNNQPMLHDLQHAVARLTIHRLLREALQTAGAAFADVKCLSIAGNSTMLHLLAGIDPTPMGVAPFTPVFLEHRILPAGQVFGESSLHPDTPVHLLPGAAAYIGADLTAGIVATNLLYETGPSLLVDVGTNGEIILKAGQELIGCATAAGPAFEGSRLTSGMRAADGAISHVRLDSAGVHCQTIGDLPPIGICGSAYVDFLATAYEAGVLMPTGRFDASARPDLADRIIDAKYNDKQFVLAFGPGKQPIGISQADVASLLQAKAAIAAGILTLLRQCHRTPADIMTLYLAGGFGTHLDRRSAIVSGLLPGFTEAQIKPVGNTSLAGAYLALTDRGLLDDLRKAAARVRVVELNLDPEFEATYIDQLCLGG